ncbi:hypothetical protein A3F52_05190 [Candidatus Uhrbacteria bacterium RIFCSPHIGHO2_12_FULL_47_11]|nr:MAG: hypothetical protein A2753_00125 [Candidatus Uhrbacteria bacterium RIFCSPHIGHO2_01_FULL_47_11]OGL68191.1 MAG: hypothetical protein A3D58_04230 [Candidatus Uhrbacteria bacterium RIFCSPHIGHO2_02_FULL_46_47]OGL76032.1 MAG: hypothetical protein A3F52_05190 [Candidatus Uhrbacteria bacterium RIFCSPHIGHO2_12_FULL_47_11]OGL83829.1 MAG: hypothetical protein A3J03_02910 [Candidatus Uhrbacteria bacterium RIFCSPLOWO2_02_FULL_46_25]OGL92372.1 MAG: hypothetical protein A3H11_03315 [Candidatus Uhrbact
MPIEKVLHKELSYNIVGILYATHNELGRYANEKQYGDLIENKLKGGGISYEREKVLDQYFPAEHPGRHRIDFLIDDKIILELKCKRFIGKEEYYQTQRYLHALNKKLGILINFRTRFLQPHRVINSTIRNS